ncbi:MAG: molybdopterin-synthase adenylyltransferase MoeB [Pseudomonadota bacterium]
MLALVLGVGIIALGHFMKVPWSARFYMLGLLYVAVMALVLVLPEGAFLRRALGGSAEPWIVLGLLVVCFVAYRAVLGKVRRHAVQVQTERGDAPPSQHGAPFNDDELERYARHITLPEIGGPGQHALKEAKVLVVGAGGLGAPILLYLGAAGIGRLGIIDADTVALSNLARQVIHTDGRQDMPKVFSAQAAIAERNPFVDIRPYNRLLDEEIAPKLFAEYDLILDGTDTFAARAMVNRAAVQVRKPLISGAISAWEGQVTIYDPAQNAPCMACIFPVAPDPNQVRTCAETGVIGALPGIIGTMMAAEAIKEITASGRGLRGRMLIYDALHADARTMNVARARDCPVCGNV